MFSTGSYSPQSLFLSLSNSTCSLTLPLSLFIFQIIYIDKPHSHLRIYKTLSCESSNRHYYPIKVRGNYEGQLCFNHNNRGQGSHLENYSKLSVYRLCKYLMAWPMDATTFANWITLLGDLKYAILYMDLGSSCIPHGPRQGGEAATLDIAYRSRTHFKLNL